MKCIIVDDEPLAIEIMESYVNKVDQLKLEGTFRNAVSAFTFLQQHSVDLIFLDIQMPRLSGIDFLKTLKNPPKVIFTTAFRDYALDGFELEVADYLLKPIPFDRFLKAAMKAREFYEIREKNNTAGETHFYIKSDSKLVRINYDDILFVEALQNYVAVYTTGKKLITHSTLKSVQQSLPENFIQPHKSYIINMNHVTAIEGNILHSHGYQVPISKYQKDEVMAKILRLR